MAQKKWIVQSPYPPPSSFSMPFYYYYYCSYPFLLLLLLLVHTMSSRVKYNLKSITILSVACLHSSSERTWQNKKERKINFCVSSSFQVALVISLDKRFGSQALGWLFLCLMFYECANQILFVFVEIRANQTHLKLRYFIHTNLSFTPMNTRAC